MTTSVGELVAANVADRRVWDAYGESSTPGIYLPGPQGRALPFVVYRAWKVPNGLVAEEIRLISPSGRTLHRWGPNPRRMLGMMDLTVEVDTIEDAILDETGTFVVSFIIDGVIVAETEVPVYVQAAPTKFPKEVEDGFKKSDVIWIGVERSGERITSPSWFSYKDGKIYALSQRQPGPQEQTLPGVPGAKELLLVTRRKGRDTSLGEFPASLRLLEGAEWEAAAVLLADKRKSRAGAPQESITRWRSTCDIVELTPVVPE
ncbi:MAG: hypothetical protein HY240_09045 [Actinobacteria bacterium]|nr:hypothetical protein [Actinomycetota bacterium]